MVYTFYSTSLVYTKIFQRLKGYTSSQSMSLVMIIQCMNQLHFNPLGAKQVDSHL